VYACQDEAFDRAAGLHSIPARFGVKRSLRLAALCHAAMLALLVLLASLSPHLGTVYLGGLAVIGVLLLYEHSLVRADDLSRVNRAFFHVNGVISVGLLGLVILQFLLKPSSSH
jgi:4-hydroxybenzoate polyprenyltransferase